MRGGSPFLKDEAILFMTKKMSDPYDIILDDEQEIESALNFDKIESVDNVQVKIATLKETAKHHLRKDKKINIRITSSDLLRLKEAAENEGLPYQTLIASVLHKYAVGQAVHQ